MSSTLAHAWRRVALSSSLLNIPLLTPLHVEAHQRRCIHAERPANMPPPLAAAAVRRRICFTTGHSSIGSQRTASVTTSSGMFASWIDLLADSQTTSASSSRVVLSEVATLCLAQEAPKCYAVYRPSNTDGRAHRHTLPATARATPLHFLELLSRLREAFGTSTEAPRIAEVLVDLLNKPSHPHQLGHWDLAQHEVRAFKATAIQHAMDSAQDGDSALAWLTRLLRPIEARAGEKQAAESESKLLLTALSERINIHCSSAARLVLFGDADGEWLLTSSPKVLAAIAAAMLRSTEHGMKAQALELLEAAALSRLSRASLSSGESAVCPSYCCSAPYGAPRVLFDESVAVHCAEAAAVQGDAETVTRLIFLLYRARGALGFATLAERRQKWRIGRACRVTLRETCRGFLPHPSAWFSTRWWGTGYGDMTDQTSALGHEDAADMRFESAVVHLLKSAMQALLYNPQRVSEPIACTVEEALALWDGLKGATSWPGLVAISAELLRYLVDQHTRLAVAADQASGDGVPSKSTHIRRAALQVYGDLCRSAPKHQRTTTQRNELNHLTLQMMRAFSFQLEVSEYADMPIPVVANTTAAEHILRLFANLSSPLVQEAALPYALAASLVIFAAAATLKGYRVTSSLLTPLAAYFSETQSLHYYCVAAMSIEAPKHVAVSGSLVLLHVLFGSCVPQGEWARGDGELWPLLQLMQTFNSTGQGADAAGVPPVLATDDYIAAWLRIAGDQQRSLLWHLLISVKQCDTLWSRAVVNALSSPASSTLINKAVSSVYVQLPMTELRVVMTLLYACGNNDSPAHATETLDRVVSASLKLPIRVLTLETLGALLERLSFGRRATSVLVLGSTTVRALAERCATTSRKDADGEMTMEGFLRVLQPLLQRSAAASLQSVTVVVLTQASLVQLHRLYMDAANGSQHVPQFTRALYYALVNQATPSAYQVHAASSWPLLSRLATARRAQRELQGVDGLREATAAARFLENTLPEESRPTVCLWAEGEELLASPEARSAQNEVLRHYGVRKVNTHRAHVEKVKRDIVRLARSGATGTPLCTGASFAGETAVADAKAARWTRHNSLLNAVSEKSRRHRSL